MLFVGLLLLVWLSAMAFWAGGLTDGADAVPDDSLSSETATSFSAPAPSSGGGYFRVRSISQTADGSIASDYATLPLDGRPLTQAPVAPVPSGGVAPVPISRPATPRIAPLVPEVTKRPPVVSVVSPVEPGGSIQWQVDRGDWGHWADRTCHRAPRREGPRAGNLQRPSRGARTAKFERHYELGQYSGSFAGSDHRR